MTNTNVNFTTKEELGKAIVTEARRYAYKMLSKYGSAKIELMEVESYLQFTLYRQVHNKPEFHNTKGLRSTLNMLCKNFLRDYAKYNNEFVFSSFENDSDDSEDCSYNYEGSLDSGFNLSQDVEYNEQITNFRNALTDRQREILDLVMAGYEIKEIAETLGVHRNTPRNELNKIKDIALDYGLDMLLK